MKQIRLTSFGFTRDKTNDFIDDGNSFKCYRFGKNVEVTFHRMGNTVFITGRIRDERIEKWPLNYMHNAWRLTGYDIGWKYNGEADYKFDGKDFIRLCQELDTLLEKPDAELFTMIDKIKFEEMVKWQLQAVETFMKSANDYGKKMIAERLGLVAA